MTCPLLKSILNLKTGKPTIKAVLQADVDLSDYDKMMEDDDE